MLSKADREQATQLIDEADRAVSELGDVLNATRAQLKASREVTCLVRKVRGLGCDISQNTASAGSQVED